MAYSGTNTIHATFNWNPAYDAYKHVAMWGNDFTGDGTKKYPYRTLFKACSVGGNVVVGSMTIRETFASSAASLSNKIFVADGNVIIDVSISMLYTGGNPSNITFNGFKFVGTGGIVFYSDGNACSGTFNNCEFDNVVPATNFQVTTNYCTFKNINSSTGIGFAIGGSYNTIYNCNLKTYALALTKSIIKDSIINILYPSNVGVNSFLSLHNTTIQFASGTGVVYTDLTTLKSALTTAGGTSANLQFIYFLDPLFNKPSIGDLTLAYNSPCKNLSYFGDIIGATSIGVSLVASTTSAASAFDNSSFVNLTVNGTTGALTMTDTSINSLGTTKPIANLQGRNISNLSTFGFFSDRNGEYIDSTPDIDYTGIYAAGDTLTTDRIYIVDGSGGQVSYNGTNYAVGDRFTCRAAASTFSNLSVVSFLREVTEAPTRNNIEARFSNGNGVFKNNGDTLTAASWYFLSVGTATYASVAYTAGQFIKGDGSAIASTGATIEEVFTSSQGYQYYETVGSLNCNRVGNVFTGVITYGNGDPAFDRTIANVFKISSKFIQIRYTIQANNLIP